jgi:flagellar biosynthesis protein FliQ
MPAYKFIAPVSGLVISLAMATTAVAETSVDALPQDRLEAIKVAFAAEDPVLDVVLNDSLTKERFAKMKEAYKTHDPESLRLARK